MAGPERFTSRSRRVLSLAHQAAERLRNQYIDTEHLLQKLARSDSDFDPNSVELSGELQTALKHSVEEARRLGENYIDTEYLLLGLVKFENRARAILEFSGATPEQILGQIREVLIESGTPSPLTKVD